MKRQIDKTSTNLNFKFSVVEYIRQHNILPNWLNSRASLNYYIKPLKIEGVLINVAKSIWYVNWEKWGDYYRKELKKISDKSDNLVKKIGKGTSPLVRGHGYQFYLKIPKRIRWTEYTRSRFIEKTNLANGKKENGIFKIRVCGHKVWFCEEGIIVYFPPGMDFRGDSAKQTKNMAVYEFRRVITRISNLIRTDLTEKGKLLFTIDKQHYAEIENELAIEYNKNKDKLKVIGDDGKVWLLIDFSERVNEIECVHPKKSDKDYDDVINPYFNDIRSNKDKVILPSELSTSHRMLIKDISSLTNLMGGVTKNQVTFDANMMSHISAVKELALGVQELRKEIKNINNRKV